MKELRALTESELKTKLLDLKSKLSLDRGKVKSNIKPDKPGEIRTLRRDIARILTLLREKELKNFQGGTKING